MESDHLAWGCRSRCSALSHPLVERSRHRTCHEASECHEACALKCTSKGFATDQTRFDTNRRSACLSMCERFRFVVPRVREFLLLGAYRRQRLSVLTLSLQIPVDFAHRPHCLQL